METTLVIQTYRGTDGVQVPAFSYKGSRVAQCEIGGHAGWRTLTLTDGTRTRTTLREIQMPTDADDEAMNATVPRDPARAAGRQGACPGADERPSSSVNGSRLQHAISCPSSPAGPPPH